MPKVVRKGDIGTGHSGWPPRVNDQGSSNVFVNSIEAHRQDDHWAIHCKPQVGCHDSTMGAGSSTVFVNGKKLARIGDPINCGSSCADGSPNVFAGG